MENDKSSTPCLHYAHVEKSLTTGPGQDTKTVIKKLVL